MIDQDGKAMRDYAVEALPTSILIDRDGKEVKVLRKQLQDKNVFK